MLKHLGYDLPEKHPAAPSAFQPCIGSVKRQSNGSSCFVEVFDLLPPLSLLGKGVHCHLSYEELPADHPIWEEGIDGSGPLVFMRLNLLGEKRELLRTKFDNIRQSSRHDPADAHHELGITYMEYRSILEDAAVQIIEFHITIFISQGDCPGYAAIPQLDEQKERFDLREKDLAAIRREHAAFEITTGYRHYISHLLLLIHCAAAHSKYHNGRPLPLPLMDVPPLRVVSKTSKKGDLHATTEDAWRLLCTFHSVEVAAKRVNREIKQGGYFVLSLQDFVFSLTESPIEGETETTAAMILSHLYHEKSIKRNIGLRKALEYYIYEALPNLPHDGGP